MSAPPAVAFSYNNIVDKKPAERAATLLDQPLASLVASYRLSQPQPHTPSPPAAPRRRPIPELEAEHIDAFIVDDLLSAEECDALLQRAETVGWSFWKATSSDATITAADIPNKPASASGDTTSVGECDAPKEGDDAAAAFQSAKAFRSADTIEIDTPMLTSSIWERLVPFFEGKSIVFDESIDPDHFETDCVGEWFPTGLSPNALFARYLTGGHFAPHIDGASVVDFNHRTMYTVLVYLNDCKLGGETRMLRGDQRDCLHADAASGRVCGDAAHGIYEMKPSKGAAIVFKYSVLHEGVAVGEECDESGRSLHQKYIFRGDVLLERRPVLCDSAVDREAFDLYQKARVTEANGDAMAAMQMFRRVRKLSPTLAGYFGL